MQDSCKINILNRLGCRVYLWSCCENGCSLTYNGLENIVDLLLATWELVLDFVFGIHASLKQNLAGHREPNSWYNSSSCFLVSICNPGISEKRTKENNTSSVFSTPTTMCFKAPLLLFFSECFHFFWNFVFCLQFSHWIPKNGAAISSSEVLFCKT